MESTCESRSIIHERSSNQDQFPKPELEILDVSTETTDDSTNGLFKYDDLWLENREVKNNKKNKKGHVFLEGYVETSDEDDLGRTKSLTDEDLEELKGCVDLGFGFSYAEIPELCNTLPALELCYSISQKFLDEHQRSPECLSDTASSGLAPIPNWKISSPGDSPDDVKARLKFWAQAVACTVRLCS